MKINKIRSKSYVYCLTGGVTVKIIVLFVSKPRNGTCDHGYNNITNFIFYENGVLYMLACRGVRVKHYRLHHVSEVRCMMYIETQLVYLNRKWDQSHTAMQQCIPCTLGKPLKITNSFKLSFIH